MLILSLMLQLYVVISPFYMQLAIDQAALKGDRQLLTALAIGFGLFSLFNIVAGVIRSFAMQQVAAHLSWDMSLRLFRHLVRLPLPWFQRRRLADTISRFDAINPIRDQVSGAFISSLIDGVLACVTLILMFLFAWQLAVCVLFAFALYVALRVASLQTSLRLGAEGMLAHIAESGKRIETLKAIQTIKVMSGESTQEAQWSNRYADVIKRNLISSRFNISVGALHQVFDAFVGTIVIYIGAGLVISGNMTVGLLYAFMAYKSQFSTATTNIVEQIIQWKLNDIYSYRLADIVLSPREVGIDDPTLDAPVMLGAIELENLSYRYSPHEPYVFKHLDLKITPGEMIAVVGASGAGKSTLLKVMYGLYPASSGEVRFDGKPLSFWGPRALRQNFGVVMQDDELLSGSIAENVAFFDENIEMDRVWRALEGACLKDEVQAMPMKAESFVGDMGGALSGGQKQRLLIARALYRNPRILFLDEATSHLDLQNEAFINARLKELSITRVIVAHRPETIKSADRVFDIRTGKIVPLPQRDASGSFEFRTGASTVTLA